MLVASCLRREDTESLAAMNEFIAMLNCAPTIVYTDSDAAMAAAIQEEWADSTHLLCSFHIFKNLYEHLHRLFIGQSEEWRELLNLFWRICKETGFRSCDQFQQHWEELISYFKVNAKGKPEKARSTEYQRMALNEFLKCAKIVMSSVLKYQWRWLNCSL
ncbi:MAG: hypothetical protein ACREOZ_03690 [Gloeomargaritales cyanobacterium]